MSTKIIIENNKIVFEGHSDNTETCRTITALCDALAANENFSTIKYESGYAEFERVSGGDSLMFVTDEEFAALVDRVEDLEKIDFEKMLADYLTVDDAYKTYVSLETYQAMIQLIQEAIDQINNTLGYVDTTMGTVGEQLINNNTATSQAYNAADTALNTCVEVEKRVTALEESSGSSEELDEIRSLVNTLEAKITAFESKASRTLPFTVDEVIAKLNSIS